MMTSPGKPLEIAARVLSPQTLQLVSRSPFNRFGWAILDRWAYNSPTVLKALEAEGPIPLYNRLLEQQETEQSVLTQSMESGQTDMEVLAKYQVQTELEELPNSRP